MEPSTRADSFCADHRPQIDFMRKPAAKVCSSCGAVEQLSPTDFAAPAPRSRLLNNRLKRFAPGALAASSALIAIGALLSNSVPAKSSKDTSTPSTANELSKKTPLPATAPVQSADAGLRMVEAQPAAVITEKIIARSQPAARELPKRIAPAPRQYDAPSVAGSIISAINARAISGVAVRYDNGTAYLSGKVQTASQRSAAESAAKTINGVQTVVSSIRVEWQE